MISGIVRTVFNKRGTLPLRLEEEPMVIADWKGGGGGNGGGGLLQNAKRLERYYVDPAEFVVKDAGFKTLITVRKVLQ